MRDKYIGVYTINIAGVRHKIKKKRIKLDEPVIKFAEDAVFNINFKAPFYRANKTIYYFFEKGKGQVSGTSKELAGNEGVLKSLFLDELPKQLTSGIEHKTIFDMDVIIFVVLSLIAGTGLGYILAGVL